MKFTAERDALAKLVATVGRAAVGKTSPILLGTFLSVADGTLTALSTDLDLTIRSSVGVQGDADGAAVVPARLTAQILSALPGDEVTVETGNNGVTLESDGARFTVRSWAAEDFPRLPDLDGDGTVVPNFEFGNGLRRVVQCASSDDARPILTGVLATMSGGTLRLVATDSYRMGIADVDVKDIGTSEDVLIPARALDAIQRVMVPSEDMLVKFGQNMASFATAGTTVLTRLLDGTYPNYAQLIPEGTAPNSLTVSKVGLLSALKRMKLLVRDNTTPVRLTLEDGGVGLTVASQEIGEATEHLSGEYDGAALTVGFNPNYLADAVEAAPGDDVTLNAFDASRPVVVINLHDGSYRGLVMPVRLS